MIEKFEFKNGTVVTFDLCKNLISFNNKPKYHLKGSMKFILFKNKKFELDGIIFKTKDVWGRICFIVINENDIHLRKSINKCLDFIPTLENDKKKRIRLINDLKI